MLTITSEAKNKVMELLSEQEPGLGLRISIKSGGCSGFSYGLALDMKHDGDMEYEFNGINVLINQDSEPLLNGSEIDYQDGLSGAGFKIMNPNAVSTCGCGSSFRTKEEAGQPNNC